MVKINYSCSICKKQYNSKANALACENQGIIGKNINPGLTLIRLDTNRTNLYENLFLILGRETQYAKIKDFAHYKVYRVGLVDFDEDHGEYSWDRWIWQIEKSQKLEKMLKDQKLRPSTKQEIKELSDYFEEWRNKIKKALKSSISGPEPYKGCLEPEIINSIDEYNLILHNNQLK